MSLPEQYSVTQTGAPAAELMTTAEAKIYLRVDHEIEDDLIDAMNKAARKAVENFTSRQLITATWVLRMDCFPAVIEPPHPPLLTVTSLAYVDQNGDSQTLTATTEYTVDIYSTPGRIVPAYSLSWPSTYGHINDVILTYTAGYGAAASSVPEPLRQAHKLILGHYYENREQFIAEGSVSSFPTAELLMWEYRVAGKR